MRRLAILALCLLGLAAPAAASGVEAGPDRAAWAQQRIGHSVQGRPIVAYHLGDGFGPTVVLIAGMHGNEAAPVTILRTLAAGLPVHRLDLWVVPSYNPDGLAAHDRHNARGVDLNRNFPHDWAPLTGNYYSGPRPASEPETRAVMGFLREVRPDYILSFHQPLNGVDIATKRPGFARLVARRLHLPTTNLDCGGTCHGTMTSWFNATHPGFALTVEYGATPGARRMRVEAPGQVLGIWGAWRAQDGVGEVP